MSAAAVLPACISGGRLGGVAVPAEELQRRLARQQRFWGPAYAGEGAYFSVTAPLETAEPLERNRAASLLGAGVPDLADFLNAELQAEWALHKLASTYFGGDAVPVAQVDFGPGLLPAVLGRPYRLGEGTVWFDGHALSDPAAVERLALDKTEPIYQSCLKTTELLLERAQGRYVVALSDIGSTIDVLAALYRRDLLLMDMVSEPDLVKSLLVKAVGWWREAVAENLQQILAGQSCVSTWIPIVNSRTWYAQLSELSAMISTAAFEQLSLPALAEEAELFEQIVFNIDGDSYARHLDSVLKIPKLHAIDWAPTRKYVAPFVSYKVFTEPYVLDMARRIQKQVKLVVNGIPARQVPEVLDGISADGTFLIVHCDSQAEAEEFVAASRIWIRQ